MQALIAAGHTTTDAGDLDEFASQLYLWDYASMDNRVFSHRPAPWHD